MLLQRGERLRARVFQVTPSEIFVYIPVLCPGLPPIGVMDLEEFDERLHAGYDLFLGVDVPILVTGVDPDRRLLLVSLVAARRRLREEAGPVKLGQIVEGEVIRLTPGARSWRPAVVTPSCP